MNHFLDSYISAIDTAQFPMTKGNPANYVNPEKLVDEYLTRQGFNSYGAYNVRQNPTLARRVLGLSR
jgi:hypothetical protein